VFENRVLRIIFVAKRDEVKGDWRELHNEERASQRVLMAIYKIRMIKLRNTK
jgi:hypothetical protein